MVQFVVVFNTPLGPGECCKSIELKNFYSIQWNVIKFCKYQNNITKLLLSILAEERQLTIYDRPPKSGSSTLPITSHKYDRYTEN